MLELAHAPRDRVEAAGRAGPRNARWRRPCAGASRCCRPCRSTAASPRTRCGRGTRASAPSAGWSRAVEVGREVADAQAPAVRACDAARQRPVQLGDVQRVVARRPSAARADRRRARRAGTGRSRRECRPAGARRRRAGRAITSSAAAQRHASRSWKASCARAARSLLPRPSSDRGADAFGGLGLHADLLERHAEAEVRERIVHLQRQGVEERADRLLVTAAALQRDRERDVVVDVARRHRPAALAGISIDSSARPRPSSACDSSV